MFFRALAIAYPRIAPKIHAMDELRMNIIREMLAGIGYEGAELRMRVHTFFVLHSMESAIVSSLTPDERRQLFDERVKLVID